MLKSFVKWTLAGALLLAIFLPAAGWQLEARKAQNAWDPVKARHDNQPIPVRVSPVEQELVEDVIGGTCVTMPSAKGQIAVVTMNREMSMRTVSAIHVKEGDYVKKGQLLVEFDRELFAQIVKHRQAEVAKATEELRRFRRLRQSRAVQELEVRAAEAKLEDSKAQLLMARHDLKLCTLNSPLSGLIGAVAAVPGVSLPGTQELTGVSQIDPILVRMDFPLERLKSLSEGCNVEVVLDSFPEEAFRGTVVRLAPFASPQSRILQVFVEIPNPDLRLRPGITGYSRMKLAEETATIVPHTAVIRRGGRAMAFVVKDDRANIREFEAGAMVKEGFLQVDAGLEPGEQVVIFGQQFLQDGDRVDTNWKKWARRE